MTTLIFEPTLTGHHLEYLHHLYAGAMDRAGETFVFAVPRREWEQMRGKFQWPEAGNVTWLMLDDAECARAGSGSQIVRCWRMSRFIRRTALAAHADRVLLISLAGAIPFLPLMLPSHIKLSGIIYKIYLRAPQSRMKLLIDRLRYTVMARSRSMGTVFILNDPRSAEKLRNLYNSDRFVSLPDPVPDVDPDTLRDLRPEFGIPASDRVYLHFGAMDERKGTLDILRAILLMTPEELADKTFIFAGRVGSSIREEFYALARQAESRDAHIIIRDEFVDYDLLNSLCHTCDCILIPYRLTDLSSGALGYAAVHRKPVIGPSTGLIGDLIRDNGLGISISISPHSLQAFLSDIRAPHALKDFKAYTTINSIPRFITSLLDS